MFHTVIRRATLFLVALFAFSFASMQSAFAEEGQDGDGNVEIEAVADNAVADNAVADNAVADNANQGNGIPRVITDASILKSEDWIVVPEEPVGKRIGTDIAFGILYSGALMGAGFGIWARGFASGTEPCEAGYELPSSATREDERACWREREAKMYTGYAFMGLGAVLGPALAVHTSHAIWGGEGSIGWTYLGGLIGGVVGYGIGFLPAYFADAAFMGLVIGPVIGFVGGMLGAILGYELTNFENREMKYGTISRVYPVLDFSPERSVVGVGIEF